MKKILLVARKEVRRFFSDRHLILISLLFPGLLLFGVYRLMDTAFENRMILENEPSVVSVVNMPLEVGALFEQDAGIDIQTVLPSDTDAEKERIQDGDAALLVVFPGDFSDRVTHYDIAHGNRAPNIELYYDSGKERSVSAYSTVVALLHAYENVLCNKFDVNAGDADYDLATAESTFALVYALMLPTFLTMFIFMSSIQVASETIAGEKERGTLGAVLLTPLSKKHFVAGKVLGLTGISLIAAVSACVGAFFGLSAGGNLIDLNGITEIYTLRDFAAIIVVVLSVAIFIVSLVTFFSTLARNAREAQSFTLPVMLLGSFSGMSLMLFPQKNLSMGAYCIPVFGSVKCFYDIFSLEPPSIGILIVILENIALGVMIGIATSALLKRERIVFPK